MEIYGVNEKSLQAPDSPRGSCLLQDALEQPTARFDLIKQGLLLYLQTCSSQVSWLTTRARFWWQQTRGIRWSHGKYSVFKEVNVYHLQRCLCWIWSTGGLQSHSPGTCSLHRSQRCYSPFQSSSWINKTKHPQHAAPRAAMPSHIFHLWFLPPENVSDSQQGGLTEQPKHSHRVTSINWEKENKF